MARGGKKAGQLRVITSFQVSVVTEGVRSDLKTSGAVEAATEMGTG